MGITLLFLDEKFYRCEDPISTINFVFHPQKFRTKETTNQLREPDSKRLIDVIAANGVLFIMAALRIESSILNSTSLSVGSLAVGCRDWKIIIFHCMHW
ncbi:unnamed protein product [Brassica oleracea]